MYDSFFDWPGLSTYDHHATVLPVQTRNNFEEFKVTYIEYDGQ